MSYTTRFGLEYETLIHVKDVTDPNKSLKKHLLLDQTTYNPTPDYLANALVFLKQRKTGHHGCFRKGTATSTLHRNVLARLYNDKLFTDNQAEITDNKKFFKVTDGYKMDPCMPPGGPSGGWKTTFGKELDTKYTWIVTQDSSVVYDTVAETVKPKYYKKYTVNESKDVSNDEPIPENVVEGVEIVSPPLMLADIDTSLNTIFTQVLKDDDYMDYFNNKKTSNHLHISLSRGDIPIWVDDSSQLLKICMGWWYYEPIFYMLCGWWRRNNDYAGAMNEIMHDKYKNEEIKNIFYDGDRAIEGLKKLSPAFKKKVEDALKQKKKTFKGFNLERFRDEDPTKQQKKLDNLFELLELIFIFQGHPGDHSSRYAGLNLLNTVTSVGTVEVRIKHGTTDYEEIKQWITLMTTFFNYLLNQDKTINNYVDENIKKSCYYINNIFKFDDNGRFQFRNETVVSDKPTIDALSYTISHIFNDLMKRLSNSSLTEFWIKRLEINMAAIGLKYVNSTRSETDSQASTQLLNDNNSKNPNNIIPALGGGSRRQRKSSTPIVNSKPSKSFVQQQQQKGVDKKTQSRNPKHSKELKNESKQTKANPKSVTQKPAPRKRQTPRYNLFCYGSNGTKQLTERVEAEPGEIVAEPAYLKGYTRIFAGYSSRWDGGVASVHPHNRSRVYGAVVKLTKAQLRILDQWEGGYVRKTINVNVSRNKTEPCYVYIKKNYDFVHPPSEAYLKAIRAMLNETRNRETNIHVRGVVKDSHGEEKVKKVMQGMYG